MARGIWVLGEERNGRIHTVSFELLAWGRGLADAVGETLTCVILGAAVTEQASSLIAHGADRVVAVSHPGLGVFLPDPHVRVLTRLVKEYEPEVLLASATTMGRTLMPILAARLHTGLTADCTGLEMEPAERLLLQSRPAIGGNVMATIKTPSHRPQMATVRPRSRNPLPRDAARRGEIIEERVDEEELASCVKRLGFEPDPTSEAPIEDADVVIAGGKGFKNAKGFAQTFEIATHLGGAVGASRPAVDQGWVGYAHQVGLSGKSVTPKLYMALGISGSANHVAGMSSAETVVAVNKDPEAGIFRIADFGIVGSLEDVVPVLLERLDRATHARSEGTPYA